MRGSNIFSYLIVALMFTAMVTLMEHAANTTSTPETSDQGVINYNIGYKLGECLVTKKCRVFIGTIRAIGSPEAEAGDDTEKAAIFTKVAVTIDQWILDGGADQETEIQIITAARPALTKTAIGPWTAWDTVNITIGGKLLVALWGEEARQPVWGGIPEKVAVAISEEKSFTAILDIIQKHKEYEVTPAEFTKVTQMPDLMSNSFFIGYAMAYLRCREEIRNVDNAAIVLSSILNNEQAPEYIWRDIPIRLLGNFYRLSAETRRTSAESLIIAGVSDNIRLAESAINILVRLSDDKLLDMRPLLTPERQRKLIENYRRLMPRGSNSQQDHSEFESQLGIKKS